MGSLPTWDRNTDRDAAVRTRPSPAKVIEVQGLTKIFTHERSLKEMLSGATPERSVAVNNVSFDLYEREVFGLVGPNGAGKTTLIKLLSTLLLPTSGSATIYGFDIQTQSARVREKIGLVTSNERSFFWRLTGRQNLRFFADLYHLSKTGGDRWIAELLDMLELSDIADLRFDSYSTGTKQRMAIARGLLSKPKVLFMDEPTKGVDPSSSAALIRLIRDCIVDKWHQTVVITTHNLREIEQLCDRTMIMDQGSMVYLGAVSALKETVFAEELYQLRVGNLSREQLERLAAIVGVAKSVVYASDGAITVELKISKGSVAFAQCLRYIVERGGDILTCRHNEIPIEDAFVAFIENLPGHAARRSPSEP
ncbi:MAG: ABC transporter ATP-binding protein [Gammaproteobacteria bacterium]